VFVAMPVTTFLTSPGELGIHLDRMITINGRNVMVVLYSGLIIYALVFFAEIRATLTLLVVPAFFICWLYAFVMPFGYPMMSGLAFEQVPTPWLEVLLRSLLDLLILLGLIAALRFFFRRKGARPVLVVLMLANLSIVLAVAIEVGRGHAGEAGVAKVDPSLKQPIHLSTSNPNVLIIFLDRFMGSYMEAILEKEPELAQRLSGFTWYPRTVSAGENSIAGIHPMLGGYDYTPSEMNARQRPLRELSIEAFSILPYNFAKKSHRVNVISPRGLGFTMKGDCSFFDIPGVSCSHIPASISQKKAVSMGFSLHKLSEANYGELLVILGSMRVAPYLFKEIIYTKGPWQTFLDHSAGTTFREWAELDALDEMTAVDDGASSFNFISNILPHEPYYIGEDCLPRQTRLEASAEHRARLGYKSLFSMQHAVTAHCSLALVANYMDFLKQKGVYDNTKVIVVSDHGIVGDVVDTSSRAVAGGATANKFVRLRPLVLVKEAGAEGPLTISEAFMPNAEVPIMACKDIGGCVNPYLGDKAVESHGRNDPFITFSVPWQFSAQQRDKFVIKSTLVLRGKDPFKIENWVEMNEVPDSP
ncbi:MAG: hypothetical protein Q8J78_01035, partial [Moraxellaceae bacterium]|nr:hypothetical protein [Moraxellaceae bacterium]